MSKLFLVKEKQEKENEEMQRLAEMSEDEYDSLTDLERKMVDDKRLVIKKERMKR